MNVKEKKPVLTVPANIKWKKYTAEARENKYINCITYNRYNKQEKMNENHSELSKECPSLQAVPLRHRNNIEY